MTTIATYPVRTLNQAVAIVAEAHTELYRFTLSADGVVCIQLNELRDESQDPEFIRETKHQAGTLWLNTEGIEALHRFLVSIQK